MSLVPTLLVSFPNQLTSKGHSLIAIDFAKEKAFWIELKNFVSDIGGGVSGICNIPGFIAICTQSVAPAIVILNHNTLDVVFVFELKHVKDPHSMVFNKGYLYIASTGTNEIYRIKVNGCKLKNEERFWQYPDVKYDIDEVHLNGITISNDRIIATAFGKKNNSSWDANGLVFYPDTGEVLMENLSQPHTPLCKDKLFVFTESVIGKVYILEQKDNFSWCIKINFSISGYTRGIIIYDNDLYIGISSLRKVSKSRGLILSNKKEIIRTSILRVNIKDPTIRKTYDISAFSNEIYDIIPIETTNTKSSFYEALKRRVTEMQRTGEVFADQITRLNESLNVTQQNLREKEKKTILLEEKLQKYINNIKNKEKENVKINKKRNMFHRVKKIVFK
jgi:hypothetical protein